MAPGHCDEFTTTNKRECLISTKQEKHRDQEVNTEKEIRNG